jgi:hypothetical protein
MATLYCECNHKLWSEYWWGGSKHVWVLLDDERRSETYTEQVTRCPECGRQLTHDGHGRMVPDIRVSRKR